jgi:TM2 domain-containing membrane protein YozV
MPTIPPSVQGSDAARLMQYDAAKKSAVTAYLLWFFLAGWGVHRFYLGRVGSGLIMAIIVALSWITVAVGIGFLGLAIIGVWWLIDAFLIPGIVVRANQELANRLATA